MGKLRLAVLGLGGMGVTHAHNLMQLGCELVGVCGRTREGLDAGLAKLRDWGNRCEPACYVQPDGFERMLEETGPEALVVAVPPSQHAGEVELAATWKGRGIHLFLEKPIAMTWDRAAPIERAVRASGVTAMVNHHMRFGVAVRRVWELVERGEGEGGAGRVSLVQGRYFCNALHGAWWRDVTRSGGQVLEQAIHTYDLACLFGGKPRRVMGLMGNLSKRGVEGYTVEDTSAGMVEFEGGGMGSVVASNSAVPKVWESRVTVVSERMVAEILGPDEGTITWSDGRPSEWWWERGGELRVERISGKTDLHRESAGAFLRAVAAGGELRRPGCSLEDGLWAMRAVLGVVESAGRGREWVSV